MAAPEAVEKQSPQISFFIVESFVYNHSLIHSFFFNFIGAFKSQNCDPHTIVFFGCRSLF